MIETILSEIEHKAAELNTAVIKYREDEKDFFPLLKQMGEFKSLFKEFQAEGDEFTKECMHG